MAPQSYIVTAKDAEKKNKLIEEAKAAGGKITHNYTLIPAFAVEFPEGHVQTFDNNPDVQTVERDNEVRTQ
ncbi:hypothetical protein BZA05DRAFT_399609 [Tricharina praecox]|uniref:uncharacterized protein n=1 Tax=Tricharina praecox TaxID=43433 RepID=UPI0022200470|nr:uncharacterized protein BZA05DRAFT_399609 [Tricharina praecox]KAI5851052.1 hypothetical protein BZA05DRAFT_399609 [Tricharina praecox]